jgi:hypothetical protein
MKRNFLINSPLEKGDKGGCEPEVGALSSRNGRRKQKTTPSAPLLRGNIAEILRFARVRRYLWLEISLLERGMRNIPQKSRKRPFLRYDQGKQQ